MTKYEQLQEHLKNNQNTWLITIDKVQKLLNYQPKYKIFEGMDEAIDWYINSLCEQI